MPFNQVQNMAHMQWERYLRAALRSGSMASGWALTLSGMLCFKRLGWDFDRRWHRRSRLKLYPMRMCLGKTISLVLGVLAESYQTLWAIPVLTEPDERAH